MTEQTYTVDARNERDALREASDMAWKDGIEPMRVAIVSSEQLFSWGDPMVRCIVSVQGPDRKGDKG